MPAKAAVAPTPEDKKYLIDIGKDNLARVIGFVNVYDGKAKFVLTIILALTAYFLAEVPSYIQAHKATPSNPWFVAIDFFAVGCLGFFLWAVVLILLTIRPNVSQHSQKPSPFFFDAIASMALDQFRDTMSSLDEAQAVILLAEQTYDNAKVVSRKHERVRQCINRFFAGMICFFVFTLGRAILLALL